MPSQKHGKSAFRVCWFRPRTYFSGEALASRIGSSKNTVIEVGLRGLPINGNRDRVDAMAHLDHKESTVYPHCERDVSKDPFHPPGIVKLDLKKNTEDRTRSTMYAADSTVPNSEAYSWRIPLWRAAKVYHLDRRVRSNLRHELRA